MQIDTRIDDKLADLRLLRVPSEEKLEPENAQVEFQESAEVANLDAGVMKACD